MTFILQARPTGYDTWSEIIRTDEQSAFTMIGEGRRLLHSSVDWDATRIYDTQTGNYSHMLIAIRQVISVSLPEVEPDTRAPRIIENGISNIMLAMNNKRRWSSKERDELRAKAEVLAEVLGELTGEDADEVWLRLQNEVTGALQV